MGRTGEAIGHRWMVNVSRVYRQTDKLVENTIRRLRGFLWLDGGAGARNRWVVLEQRRRDKELAAGDPLRQSAWLYE
jgi:hypothetical protein